GEGGRRAGAARGTDRGRPGGDPSSRSRGVLDRRQGVTIEVRIPEVGELPAFFDQLSRVFSGSALKPGTLERNRALTELDRTLVAYDGPQLVGTAGAFSLQMTVPGDVDVAAAGVTRV